MPFSYRNATISGGSDDTLEGASAFIQTVEDVLVNEMGWVVEDDQTASAGASHKLILRSNGEGSEFSTFYVVLTSGTGGGTANLNAITMQMATAWDSSAHVVPSSGVETVFAQTRLNTRSQEDFEFWISGDSEGVVFITRQNPSTYDSLSFGRANSFYSQTVNPFPLYVMGDTSNIILSASNGAVRAIGGKTPRAFIGFECNTLPYFNLTAANQPYRQSGASSIFVALPVLFNYRDSTPLAKGSAGTLRNSWSGAGSNENMLQESTLVASGTFGVQTYRAFTTTSDSLIIRQD